MKKPKNLWQLKKKIAKLEKQLRIERIQRSVVLNSQFGSRGSSFVDNYNKVVKMRFEQKSGQIVEQVTTLGEKDITNFIQMNVVRNEKDQN